MSENRKIEFEELPWQSPAPGVRFKAHQQSGKQVRLLEFSKDFVEPGWRLRGHIGCVVEGELEIDFNGEIIRHKTGDGLFIHAGDQHKAKAVTEVATLDLLQKCQ